jgi:hypothetical protein
MPWASAHERCASNLSNSGFWINPDLTFSPSNNLIAGTVEISPSARSSLNPFVDMPILGLQWIVRRHRPDVRPRISVPRWPSVDNSVKRKEAFSGLKQNSTVL